MTRRHASLPALAILVFLALSPLVSLATPPAAASVAMAPPLAGQEARPCLDCHRAPNLATGEGVLAAQGFCSECHGQRQAAARRGEAVVPLWVDPQGLAAGRHQLVACQQCHADVARSPHRTGAGAQCLGCHLPHREGSAVRDPHLTVRCQACHHKSAQVRREPATGQVVLSRVDARGAPIALADHAPPALKGEALCARCHLPDNPVQAPAMVLPAKGVICFLCHSASLGLGSGWFGLALLIFLGGMASLIRLWFRGEVAGQGGSPHAKLAAGSESLWSTLFSRRLTGVLGVLFFDVLLQRRLLQESVRRWFVHSLIFLSLLARMALGLLTWLVTQMWPASPLALALMDKNHPFVAVAGDLLGLCLLVGVLLAVGQRVAQPRHVRTEGQDALALLLLGLIAALGFALEAARLIAGGLPAGQAASSFVAWPLALLLGGAPAFWAGAYAWLWWAHAIVAAALVAYLPFGKMRHVFAAPLSLLLNRERA